MNRKEILEKLYKLKQEIYMNNIIILSGASLVLQNIIDETGDIDLACDIDTYNSINWKIKLGAFLKEIKYKDVFEMGSYLYYPKDTILIEGFKCMNLNKCYEIKKRLNREKDMEVILKLERILKK